LAGEAAHTTHVVTIATVQIRAAERSVGYVEERRVCPNPRDESTCYYVAIPHDQRSFAFGPIDLYGTWSQQSSTVGGDTLAFDGALWSGIAWPNHGKWTAYDVTFESCGPFSYRFASHVDCCGRVVLSGPGDTTVFETEPRDFTANGVLPGGSYRLRAHFLGSVADEQGRMTFEMILEPLQSINP
jgi:hypothetical protein